MNIVPSLDQLAADPAKAQGLPRQVLLALAVKALSVHAAVTTALIVTPLGAAADSRDRLLSARQVAERLGFHVNWVYAHKDELPFAVATPGRKPRFSERGLDAYIAARAGEPVRRGA